MASATNASDLDQSLLSLERLEDRTSPDLWPERIPGVSEFASTLPESTPPRWQAEVEQDDPNMLQVCVDCMKSTSFADVPTTLETLKQFGSLTTSQLVEKVRGLQELAFQLGLEEAHEMVRGKFLNILNRPGRNN